MSEQPPDLVEVLCHLGMELRQTNELLAQVVAQNSDLMQMLGQGEQETPRKDLAGRPIGAEANTANGTHPVDGRGSGQQT